MASFTVRPAIMQHTAPTIAGGTAEPILAVEHLRTHFHTPAGVVQAVDDVSFALYGGEILALVGESGSGKSVTALSLMKLVAVPPGRYMSGSVWIDGEVVLALDGPALTRVRGRLMGMIFQNPRASLDPAFTLRSQLGETIRCHHPRLSATDMAARGRMALIEVGFSDPERVLASYPHQLSGGMCQRAALAMALASQPRVLLADEPTTALDVGVQAKILLLLKRRNRDHGLPIVLITHDFGVVRALATRIAVMYAGQIQEQGAADEVLAAPLHPYTIALIQSVPDPDAPRARLRNPGRAAAVIESTARLPLRAALRAGDRPLPPRTAGARSAARRRAVRCHLVSATVG
ncbi:MAG: ABC transporter ATP-binding protein [Gammaproteobacteria bacterium]